MIGQSQVTGVKELEEKLNQLKFSLQSSEVKNRMSKLLRDIVYRRVKSGKGVTSEDAESPTHTKLKALSQSYITFRQGVAGTHATIKTKKGKKKRVALPKEAREFSKEFLKGMTGEFFDAKRSNLTMTGQLLDSIAEENTLDGIRIYIPNTVRKNSKLTNLQIYGYVTKERPFFALTDGEYRILQNEYEKIVQEKIKVIFNN